MRVEASVAMDFRSSTQRRHWHFAAEQIKVLRSSQRADGTLALQSKLGDGKSAHLPLSAEEELSLQRFYEALLLNFCTKELELSLRVAYVAVAFFKRFALRHSLCAVACGAACEELTRAHRDYDPLGCLALTCIYIAAKTEEYRRFDADVIVRRANAEASVWRSWREKVLVGVKEAAEGADGAGTLSRYSAGPHAVAAAAIFKREMVVLSSIGFQLTVHDPFKAALALVPNAYAEADQMGGGGKGQGQDVVVGSGDDGKNTFSPEALPLRALRAGVMATLSSSALTDAGLLYAPAQLAAAAVQRALKSGPGAEDAATSRSAAGDAPSSSCSSSPSASSFFALLSSALPAGLAEGEAKDVERALTSVALALEEGERNAQASRSWFGSGQGGGGTSGGMSSFAGHVERCRDVLNSVLVAEEKAAAANAGTSAASDASADVGKARRRVRLHEFDSSDDEM